MKQPKRPAKFKSAEHKRQFEADLAAWQKLNEKWKSVSGTPKKKSKVKVVDAKAKQVTERVKEARALGKSKVDTVKGAVALKRSVMDERSLRNEKPEVVEATKAKSRALMPMYNKGPVQYVTPDIDVTTIGSRSRRP